MCVSVCVCALRVRDHDNPEKINTHNEVSGKQSKLPGVGKPLLFVNAHKNARAATVKSDATRGAAL